MYLSSIDMITLLIYTATAWTVAAASNLFEGDPCKHTSYVGKCMKSSECQLLEGYLSEKILTIQEVPHCTYDVFEEILCCPLVAAGSEVASVSPATEQVPFNPFNPPAQVDRVDAKTEEPPFPLSDIFQTNRDFLNAAQSEMFQGEETQFGAETMTKNSRSISSSESRGANAAVDRHIGLDASSAAHGADAAKRFPLLPHLKDTDEPGDFAAPSHAEGLTPAKTKGHGTEHAARGTYGSGYVHGVVGPYGHRRFNGSAFPYAGLGSVGFPAFGHARGAAGSFGSGGFYGTAKIPGPAGFYGGLPVGAGFYGSPRPYGAAASYGTGKVHANAGFYGGGHPYAGGPLYGAAGLPGSWGFYGFPRPYRAGDSMYGTGKLPGSGGGFYVGARPHAARESYATGNAHGSGGSSGSARTPGAGGAAFDGSARTQRAEVLTHDNRNVYVTEAQRSTSERQTANYTVGYSEGSFQSSASQLRSNRSSNSQAMVNARADSMLANLFLIFNTDHEYLNTRGEIEDVTSAQQVDGAAESTAAQPIAMAVEDSSASGVIQFPTEKSAHNVNDSCTSRKYAGVCTKLSDCERVNELILSKNLVQDDISTCSLGLFEEIICCPLTDIIPRISDEQAVQTAAPLPKALPSAAQRTAAGDVLQKHAYIAAVGYPDENYQDTEFRCAGVLIHPKFVLVSSSCILEDFAYYTPQYIRFGLPNPFDYDEATEPIDVNFAKWHMTEGDIAIIELAEALPEAEHSIAPACLHSDVAQPFPNESLHITHFGQNAGVIKCDLLSTNVAPVSIDRCAQHYVNNTFDDKSLKSHICLAAPADASARAAASSEGECRRCLNAAGSALSYARSDGSTCVVGIATPTAGCDSVGPVLYTNVAYFASFLQDFLEAPASSTESKGIA